MGNALAAALLKSALDAGVTLRKSAAVEGLLTEGRRISGVRVSANGGTETHEARVGVVPASGGCSPNEQLRKASIPYADQHVWPLPYENLGDGMTMGLEVRASLDRQTLIKA